MAGQEKGFIKKEVAELLGLNPSLIQFYTDQGIISPGVSAPSGRGTRRRYSRQNLFEILIVKRLVERGLSLAEAKNILKALELLSMHSSFNIHDLPQNFPPIERQRLIKRERLHRIFQNVGSWDYSHEIFLSIHYQEGSGLSVEIHYLPREGDIAKDKDLSITMITQALMVFRITDVVERVAKV